MARCRAKALVMKPYETHFKSEMKRPNSLMEAHRFLRRRLSVTRVEAIGVPTCPPQG